MSFDEVFLARLFRALRRVQLEAIVVGSIGAALQGAPITTQDVDLLIRDTRPNRQKLKALCSALQAELIPLSELASGMTMVGAEVPIDVLLNQISGGLKFPSLKSRARRVSIASETVLVADLSDIIRSKKAAGRPKDLAQLPILQDTLRVRTALEAIAKPGRGRS